MTEFGVPLREEAQRVGDRVRQQAWRGMVQMHARAVETGQSFTKDDRIRWDMFKACLGETQEAPGTVAEGTGKGEAGRAFLVEDAKRIQRDLKLGGVHVAYVDADNGSFVLAHTDAEYSSGIPLEECPVHCWLASGTWFTAMCDCFPAAGWYQVPALIEHLAQCVSRTELQEAPGTVAEGAGKGEAGMDFQLRMSRAGDGTRNEYMDHLENMFAQGYLGKEEFGKRQDAVLRAVYHSDLHPLLNDLPPLPVAPSAVPAQRSNMRWVYFTAALAILLVTANTAFMLLVLLGA